MLLIPCQASSSSTIEPQGEYAQKTSPKGSPKPNDIRIPLVADHMSKVKPERLFVHGICANVVDRLGLLACLPHHLYLQT